MASTLAQAEAAERVSRACACADSCVGVRRLARAHARNMLTLGTVRFAFMSLVTSCAPHSSADKV
eukprot:2997209-Pleurochrysis_carterae.AAC.2